MNEAGVAWVMADEETSPVAFPCFSAISRMVGMGFLFASTAIAPLLVL